jgi:hypothetical protein
MQSQSHTWSPFEDVPSPLSTDVEEIATYMRLAAVAVAASRPSCMQSGAAEDADL